MSSLETDDFSCGNLSDEVTCGVMTYLAKQEAKKDTILCGRFINESYCSKYQSYPNEDVRFNLQANGIVSKNICFNPTVMIKDGEYAKQFELLHQCTSIDANSKCFSPDAALDKDAMTKCVNKPEFTRFDIQTRPR